jgi:signal transduction histidine kinase
MNDEEAKRGAPELEEPELPLSSNDAALLLARLHDSGIDALQRGDPKRLLRDLLWVANTITRADFGSVHLLDGDSRRLELAAHGGRLHEVAKIDQPAEGDSNVIDAAWLFTNGVIVDDVRASPVYSDSTRAALIRARVLSLASTPLATAGGERMGMLTLFFEQPGRASASRSAIVDTMTRYAADFVREARNLSRLQARANAEREARLLAEAANHRRDDFLAVISHELRQPLSAALPALEVQRHAPDEEHRRRAVQIIEQQLSQLAGLVEDMADVAHINRGTLSLRRERLDLRAILRHAIDMARPAIESKGQDISISLGFEPAWVVVDPIRTKQVFSNLLHNAAAYTPKGGQVRLSLTMEPHWAVVRVLDSGVGISASDLERIFSLYARGAKTSFAPGLGIGLSVVRQVLEMHGGVVSAASDGKGHGSEFVVRVPLAGARAPEADSA